MNRDFKGIGSILNYYKNVNFWNYIIFNLYKIFLIIFLENFDFLWVIHFFLEFRLLFHLIHNLKIFLNKTNILYYNILNNILNTFKITLKTFFLQSCNILNIIKIYIK